MPNNWSSIKRALPLALLYAGLWIVLSEGDLASWLMGVPAIGVAIWISSWDARRPARLWRPGVALRFAADFIRLSFLSGIDVALRALRPSCPISPGFIDYALRLPEGAARQFFTGLIGLLPGTLSARRSGARLTVHLLDTTRDATASLRRVEADVARLFGVELAADAGGAGA